MAGCSFDNWWRNTVNARFVVAQDDTLVTVISSASKCSKMWLDETEVTPAKQLTMSAGCHWVHYQLNDATTIPVSMFWIGEATIATIELPHTVTTVLDYGLRQSNKITELVFRGKTPPINLGDCWLYGNYSLSKVYTAGDTAEWRLQLLGKGDAGGNNGSLMFNPISQYTRIL